MKLKNVNKSYLKKYIFGKKTEQKSIEAESIEESKSFEHVL